MSIVIDPYLIALPHGEEVTSERVQEYAKQLQQWEGVLRNKDMYVVSSEALNEIIELGLQPTQRSLQALFDLYDIDCYSARDFAPTTNGVLTNSEPLEDIARLYAEDNDFIYEVERVGNTEKVIPEEIRKRMPPSVAEKFVETMIMAAYSLRMQGDSQVLSLATAPLKQSESDAIMQIECLFNRFDQRAYLIQERFVSEWPLLYTPEYLYANYEIVDYYKSDPYLATYIAWCKLKKEGVKPPLQGISGVSYEFGTKFVKSIENKRNRNDFSGDVERIFKSIIFVLERLWSYGSDKHHALGKNPKMHNSPPQTRVREGEDGENHNERAARVEVTAGAKCLHLHYWQCYDGSYEFSNVTDIHNDPTIYP